MLTLIENGSVYDPEPCGQLSVLLIGDRIARTGRVERSKIEAAGLDLEVIDASNCYVVPGFIDPHEHLLGGSGEQGFSTQTPEIYPSEIIGGGITTVVGCLGVDTTTKTMPGLLAKAKALREEGLTAFIWSGGYNVPPTTLTGSLRSDLIFIDEVIGAGEIAISDHRSTQPMVPELARIVSDAHVGGILGKKAGVTHFHVGDGKERLQPLRELTESYEIDSGWLYPTHVERNRELMREAAALTKLGAFVDVDVVEEDLPDQLRFFIADAGDPSRLTVSTDASFSAPSLLHAQISSCVIDHQFPLEFVLPFVTSNTALALGLERKGRIAPGWDADIVILQRETLEIRHVIAGGRQMLKNGELIFKEQFLTSSNRRISLHGSKTG